MKNAMILVLAAVMWMISGTASAAPPVLKGGNTPVEAPKAPPTSPPVTPPKPAGETKTAPKPTKAAERSDKPAAEARRSGTTAAPKMDLVQWTDAKMTLMELKQRLREIQRSPHFGQLSSEQVNTLSEIADQLEEVNAALSGHTEGPLPDLVLKGLPAMEDKLDAIDQALTKQVQANSKPVTHGEFSTGWYNLLWALAIGQLIVIVWLIGQRSSLRRRDDDLAGIVTRLVKPLMDSGISIPDEIKALIKP